jgi:hypothetical protein
MNKPFIDMGLTGYKNELVLISEAQNPIGLIKILGNKKAYGLEEHKILVNLYALALSKTITDNVGVEITPYSRYHKGFNSGEYDEYDNMLLCMIQGGSSRHLRNNRPVILKSSINMVDKMIVSNTLKFYESRKPFSSEKTLYDIVKSVSDDFAKTANLQLVGSDKERTIENYLVYRNKNKKVMKLYIPSFNI